MKESGKMKRIFLLLSLFLFLTKSAFALGGEEFLSWINSSCFNVHIKPKGCIKIKHGHIKFGIKTTYWLPIGIMEVTSNPCDFSLGIFPFNEFSAPLSTLCKTLPYVSSSADQTSPLYQSYAHYQVHVYMIPRVFYPIIKQALMMSHFVPCLDLSISDALSICTSCTNYLDKALAPVEALQGKVNAYTQAIKDKVNKLVPDNLKKEISKLKNSNGNDDEDYADTVKKAYLQAMEIASVSPVFFSELVSPIWNVDVLSPDAYTIVPVINAAVEAGGIVTEGACDISSTVLRQKAAKLNVRGIDFSFICVGNWGHGYPRIGVVRHDNPHVSLALAGARFLHLFSTTIPILHLDVHSIKLQYVYPRKSGCFYIGDNSLPFTLKGDETKRAVFLIWKKFSCCDF